MQRLFSALVLASAVLAAQDGWKDLTTLKGWTRIPIPKTAALNPENQWKYDAASKTIVCEGDKGHEMLRSDAKYKDFVLHVEWRFKPMDGNPRYNSGIFTRASEDGEHFVQAQLGAGPNVWLFADYVKDGKKQRINLRDQMTAQRTKPPGEWNTFEVTAKGPKVSLWVNGETIGEIDAGFNEGHIGLEAEGFYIEFKNVRIKELK